MCADARIKTAISYCGREHRRAQATTVSSKKLGPIPWDLRTLVIPFWTAFLNWSVFEVFHDEATLTRCCQPDDISPVLTDYSH